jgi:hypothetical protein
MPSIRAFVLIAVPGFVVEMVFEAGGRDISYVRLPDGRCDRYGRHEARGVGPRPPQLSGWDRVNRGAPRVLFASSPSTRSCCVVVTIPRAVARCVASALPIALVALQLVVVVVQDCGGHGRPEGAQGPS